MCVCVCVHVYVYMPKTMAGLRHPTSNTSDKVKYQ